jgi:hypothetical protein
LLNEEVLAKGETIFREDASGKWVFLMALRAAINECIHFLDPKQLPALYDSLQDAHAGWALVIADHKECPKEIWPRMANHPSYVIRQRLCRDPDEDIPLSVFLQLLNDKETSVVGAAQRFLLWAHQINCFMPFGVRPPGDPQWMLWPEVYEFSQVEKPIGRKPPRPVLVSEASVKSGWLGLLCTAGAERVQGGLSPTRWELISAQPACPDNKIRYWPSRIGWLPGLKLPAFPPTNPPSLDHPETVYPRLEVLAGARRFVLWSCIPDGPGLAWSETGVADTGLDPAEGVESLGLDWCNDIPFKEDILRGLRQIGAQQLSL